MSDANVKEICELGNQQPSLYGQTDYEEGSETIPSGSRLQVESKCGTVEKKWHSKYDCCVRCGRTSYRHVAKGLCNSCYLSDYREAHKGAISEAKKEWYYANHTDCLSKGRDRREQANFSGNRDIALERDNYTCQICGKSLTKTTAVVHHLDGSGRGVRPEEKNNSLDNLQTLCRSCHSNVHRDLLNETRAGMYKSKWARNYDACIVCGTIEEPHYGRGMCPRCWRLKYRAKVNLN